MCRADSRLAPSQWETSLLSNDVSHWLGANLESAPTDVHFEGANGKWIENYITLSSVSHIQFDTWYLGAICWWHTVGVSAIIDNPNASLFAFTLILAKFSRDIFLDDSGPAHLCHFRFSVTSPNCTCGTPSLKNVNPVDICHTQS